METTEQVTHPEFTSYEGIWQLNWPDSWNTPPALCWIEGSDMDGRGPTFMVEFLFPVALADGRVLTQYEGIFQTRLTRPTEAGISLALGAARAAREDAERKLEEAQQAISNIGVRQTQLLALHYDEAAADHPMMWKGN